MTILKKISSLPAITTLDDTDILPAVHIPDGATGTKKITVSNLRTVIISTIFTTANTFSATQTIDLGTGALPTIISAQTQLRIAGADGQATRIESLGFGNTALQFNIRLANGTRAVKTYPTSSMVGQRVTITAWDEATLGYSSALARYDILTTEAHTATAKGFGHQWAATLNGSTAVVVGLYLQGTISTDPFPTLGIGAAPTAGNGLLQLASGTTKAYGIALGTAIFLYRNAAGETTLRYDAGNNILRLASTANVYSQIVFAPFGSDQCIVQGSGYGVEIAGANPRLNIGYTGNLGLGLAVDGNVSFGANALLGAERLRIAGGTAPASSSAASVLVGNGSIAVGTSISIGAGISASTAALFPASTTSISSIRIPHGSAPSSPVNGDIWTTTSGVFARINGATQALGAGTIAGSIAVNQVAVGSGTDTIAGSSAVTWDGTNYRINGLVGINGAPAARFHITQAASTTADGIRITDGAAIWNIYGDSTGALRFESNGGHQTVMRDNGRFIIGATAEAGAEKVRIAAGSTPTTSGATDILFGNGSIVAGTSIAIGTTPSASTALIIPASTTSISSIRIPHGSAPTSPVNGDFWTTTSGVFARINGATQQLADQSLFLPLAGGTMTGTLIAATPSSSPAGLRLPHGGTPTSLTNGDIWTTTGGIFARINGGTSNVVLGTLTSSQVVYGGGSGSALASTALFTDGAHLGIGVTYAADAHLVITGSSSGVSSLRITHGSAPSSPVNGDIWTTTSGLFARINGATVSYAANNFTGSITTNQVAVGSGSNAFSGSSNLTWDGTRFSTTGAINIATKAATSSSGDVWHDSTQKGIAVYMSGIQQLLTGVIFTQTAISSDVTNTTTPTTILSTGIGTKTLPANFFVAGKTVRLTIKGRISSDNASMTGTLDIKFGSTVVATTGSVDMLAFSNDYFEVVVDVTCYTTGGSGTVAAIGRVLGARPPSTLGPPTQIISMTNSSTVTLDTTASQAIDAVITWGSADTDNHITTQVCSIEVLN